MRITKLKRWIGRNLRVQSWVYIPHGLDRKTCAIMCVMEALEELKRDGMIHGPDGLLSDEGDRVLADVKSSGFRVTSSEASEAYETISRDLQSSESLLLSE